MIRELESGAPRHLSFIREKLQNVETKFKKLGYIPGFSAIEVLAGTAATVGSLASLFFYAARSHIPLISKERKVIWASSKGKAQALQVLIDSVKVAAMGVLKLIPGVGTVAAASIYSLAAQNKKLEEKILQMKEPGQPDPKPNPLQAALDEKMIEVKNLNKQLKDLQEAVVGEKASLKEMIDAKAKELEEKQKELVQLQTTFGDSQKKKNELMLDVARLEDLLKQAINKMREIEERSEQEIVSLQIKLQESLAATAKAQAELKSELDRAEQLRSENASLKRQAESVTDTSATSTRRPARKKHS